MALWYLLRATGAVTLVLLTVTVALGIANERRWAPARTPRFVIDHLHRTTSLLVVVLLAIHVTTAVLDDEVPIRLVDAVVPFAGAYRPLWLGLGAFALDLLVALVATSLLRARIGLRAWRAVHWLAYACWPVALAHGLGIGTDVGSGGWMLWLAVACAAVVVLAVGARLTRPAAPPPSPRGPRAARPPGGATTAPRPVQGRPVPPRATAPVPSAHRRTPSRSTPIRPTRKALR